MKIQDAFTEHANWQCVTGARMMDNLNIRWATAPGILRVDSARTDVEGQRPERAKFPPGANRARMRLYLRAFDGYIALPWKLIP